MTRTRLSVLLLAAAALSALALLVSLVGLVVDDRVILGAPAWSKPAKFGVSITVFLLTLAWVLSHVGGHRRLVALIGAAAAAGLLGEIVVITLQVVRGTTSHFNETTDLDGALWQAMGGLIGVVFLGTLVAAVLAARQPGLDPGLATGLRWGLAVSLVGMAEAGLMIAVGAHTVGAPDGGPGLPLVGWSTGHGDLRVAHFVGLHALQVLPLLAWLLSRTDLAGRVRARLVAVAGSTALLLVGLLAWQAMRGQSVVAPDRTTLLAAAGVVVLAAAGVALVLRSGPPARPTTDTPARSAGLNLRRRPADMRS